MDSYLLASQSIECFLPLQQSLLGIPQKQWASPSATTCTDYGEPQLIHTSVNSVLKLECVIEAKTTRLCEVIWKCHAMREPLNLTNALVATTMDIITENSIADFYNLLDSEELSDNWR